MFHVHVATHVSELEHWIPSWQQLAESTVYPNPFYEPPLLLPALRYLRDESVQVVLVEKGSQLVALAPLKLEAQWHGLPLTHLACWCHQHCFMDIPLIHRNFAREALDALRRWARAHHPSIHLVRAKFLPLRTCRGDVRVNAELPRRLRLLPSFDRAFLSREQSFAAFQENLTGKLRKEWRRKRARLNELGVVEVQHQWSAENLSDWIEEFLVLEKSSWKGRAGTALANSESEAAFFREAVERGCAADSVLLSSLVLNSRRIAMRCSFLSSSFAFAFKIAFDEALKAVSPGQLLEFENIRFLLDGQDRIQHMDSCAAPGAPLFYDLWPGTITLGEGSVGITTLGTLSQRLYGLLSRCRAAARQKVPAAPLARE